MRQDKRAQPKPPINENISAREVRLIGADGQQVGVVSIDEAAALPRAELQRIQGASHGLNATRPAAFNRSVLEFLARVDGVAPDVETS